MMANLAIDLSSSAFGIQEYAGSFLPEHPSFQDTCAVFPGFELHKIEDGMM